jgi:alpha-1,6-mannosyltransferase
VGLALAPDSRTHLTAYLALFTAGSLVAMGSARSLSGSRIAFLLFAGGLLRATLLLRSPDLSDDVRRYAWDARVGAAGISPYAHVPSDPAVARLAPEAAASVPHADVRTVYPPVGQAAFRTARSFGGGDVAFKALFAAADLSIVALIAAMGGAGAGYAAALYAFHPLPVTESAGQGHLDSLGVALLLAGMVFLFRGKKARAGVAFALSALTKYVSLAATLPLLKRGRGRLFGSALAVGVGLWALASRGGVSPVGGLPQYAERWEFNAPAYSGLAALMDAGNVPDRAKGLFMDLKAGLGHPAWTERLFRFFYAGFFARAVLGILLAAALGIIAWKVGDTETAVFASLAALLLCAPTLHPWYLLWILPFAARKREPAFLYLSFAAPVSYALLYPAAWLPRGIVYTLEYVPFGLLAARTVLRTPLSPRGRGRG